MHTCSRGTKQWKLDVEESELSVLCLATVSFSALGSCLNHDEVNSEDVDMVQDLH